MILIISLANDSELNLVLGVWRLNLVLVLTNVPLCLVDHSQGRHVTRVMSSHVSAHTQMISLHASRTDGSCVLITSSAQMSWICDAYFIHCSPRHCLSIKARQCQSHWALLAFLPWLLIVREMVMCGPLPSVPDMVPSTSQGLFHCCGLHLAPYVIPNSKCKWALCYSRKIDH